MKAVLTRKLKSGREVLAKMYHGDLYPVTYANATQATRKAVSLGDGWEVIRSGRPWLVAKVVAMPAELRITSPAGEAVLNVNDADRGGFWYDSPEHGRIWVETFTFEENNA